MKIFGEAEAVIVGQLQAALVEVASATTLRKRVGDAMDVEMIGGEVGFPLSAKVVLTTPVESGTAVLNGGRICTVPDCVATVLTVTLGMTVDVVTGAAVNDMEEKSCPKVTNGGGGASSTAAAAQTQALDEVVAFAVVVVVEILVVVAFAWELVVGATVKTVWVTVTTV